MSEVTIIGGGIARIAATMRLSEHGRRCTILEQGDTLGGKLGAHLDSSSSDWHEHAYRMYLNWYLNFWGLIDELDLRDAFEPRHNIKFIRRGEFPNFAKITDIVSPCTLSDNIAGGVIPPADMFICAYSLLDLLTQHYRLPAMLDRITVNGFMSSSPYATDAATLAKAFATYSYRTSAAPYRNFITYGAQQPEPIMWVMDGNVHHVLIKILEAELLRCGVQIRKHTRVVSLIAGQDGQVNTITTTPGNIPNGGRDAQSRRHRWRA